MEPKNYNYRFTVQATPETVCAAVNSVAAWWTINTDGRTAEVGDEFIVQFGGVHRSTQRITEMERGKRIVWHVTESYLPWLKNVAEWTGTEVIFDIMLTEAGTRLTVTHKGLTPQVDCFEQCQKGWDFFIGTSLYRLITTGIGQPDTTERTHMDIIGHVHPKNP